MNRTMRSDEQLNECSTGCGVWTAVVCLTPFSSVVLIHFRAIVKSMTPRPSRHEAVDFPPLIQPIFYW